MDGIGESELGDILSVSRATAHISANPSRLPVRAHQQLSMPHCRFQGHQPPRWVPKGTLARWTRFWIL